MPDDRPRALITGASRGIGAAIAQALAPTHHLLLGGRDRAALVDAAGGLASAVPWVVELTDSDAMARAADDIQQLDVLVHSAGVWAPGLIGETGPDTWRRLFEVNVFAVAELTRLVLPALRAAQGRVVVINSSAGTRVARGRAAYAASKFALRAFADGLHAEEAEHGVRVTSIYVGRAATDMQRQVRDAEGGAFEADRYLAPESVARAVLAAVSAAPDAHLTEIVIHPTLGVRSSGPERVGNSE
jgi:NADP-dependent 3-hydroxy acid dehydrogenase YdfG